MTKTFHLGVIYLALFQLPYPDSYQIKTSVLSCVIGAVIVRVLTNQHAKSQEKDQRGEKDSIVNLTWETRRKIPNI